MYFTGSTADAWDNLFITILSFHAILHYSWKYLINGTAHLPLKIFFYFQYLFPSVILRSAHIQICVFFRIFHNKPL